MLLRSRYLGASILDLLQKKQLLKNAINCRAADHRTENVPTES